ncbi:MULTISPECIES: lectin-like domain-containing protein [unclassified Curtobacterium]|uniref:lectin-like domain-containing protein n=1 Tax=unclassified Curtobacterium TaxID=257496 RepID=UPI003A81250C
MTAPNTPPGGRPPARSRRLRRVAAAASVLTALGVLAAPGLVPSASSADELAFPYENSFTTAAGGALHGDATVVDGRLRLTDDVKDQAGAWSMDDTFPSSLGLEVEFSYAMYRDVDDPGADGLLLFLADGAAPQGVGSFGAGLGYACRREASQGGGLSCDLPGVPGGFAGIAIDHYGNFSTPINYSGPGAQPDTVSIRGSGDGVLGYRWVAAAPAPGGTETDGPSLRKVRVTLLPGDTGELAVTVRLQDGDRMRTVLDRVPLHGDGQAPLPSTLRLGFAGATGSHVNVHEVDDLRVWTPTDVAVEQDLAPTVGTGGDVDYTVTARNVGVNASDPSALAVDVPDALQDVTWTCAAATGSSCGTGSGTGDVDTALGLPRGGSATVTVHGSVPDDADGTLESIATIRPAPRTADTNEDDNTSTASTTVTARTDSHVETDKSVSPATAVRPGDEVEYTVTARNRGPGTAEDVGAVDELPAALRFVGSPDGCTAEGQDVTCRSGAALAVGESVAFRIRARLDPSYSGDGSDVVNVATATSPTDPDGGDPSPGVRIVVVPGDDGDGDGGDGGGSGGGGGDHGGGSGGGDHRGDQGQRPAGPDGGVAVPAGKPGNAGDPGAAGPVRTGALAYTGTEGLGLVGAVAAAGTALGAAGWWLARRRVRRRTTARATGPGSR